MDRWMVYQRKDNNGNLQNTFRDKKVFNLKINKELLNSNYSLSYNDDNDLSETGLVELFIIKSNNPDFPYFKARWDQWDDMVDVDIKNVSKKVSQSFKKWEDWYLWHHSRKIIDPSRTYFIEIKTPEKDIFKGTITFNIGKGHSPDLKKPFLIKINTKK